MVRYLKSDAKVPKYEGGLGLREGFIISGSVYFENFFIMSEYVRTELI